MKIATCNLSHIGQAQATLSKKKALQILVQLLDSTHPLVQKSAAGAIYAAAGGNCMTAPPPSHPLSPPPFLTLYPVANQNELRKANAVAPLTRLLTSSDESVRQTAAGAFYALLLENSTSPPPPFPLPSLFVFSSNADFYCRESTRGRCDSYSQLHCSAPGFQHCHLE